LISLPKRIGHYAGRAATALRWFLKAHTLERRRKKPMGWKGPPQRQRQLLLGEKLCQCKYALLLLSLFAEKSRLHSLTLSALPASFPKSPKRENESEKCEKNGETGDKNHEQKTSCPLRRTKAGSEKSRYNESDNAAEDACYQPDKCCRADVPHEPIIAGVTSP